MIQMRVIRYLFKISYKKVLLAVGMSSFSLFGHGAVVPRGGLQRVYAFGRMGTMEGSLQHLDWVSCSVPWSCRPRADKVKDGPAWVWWGFSVLSAPG